MQEQDDLSGEQLELERALRSISPASAQIDPIAAAFAAGRRSQNRRVRAWASACVVLLAVASSSNLWMYGAMSVMRREVLAVQSQSQHSLLQNTPCVAVVSAEMPEHSSRALSQRIETLMPSPTLLILQRAVEKDGVDGMPTTYLPDAGRMNLQNPL